MGNRKGRSPGKGGGPAGGASLGNMCRIVTVFSKARGMKVRGKLKSFNDGLFSLFCNGAAGILEKVPNLSLNFLKDCEHQGGQGTGTDGRFSRDAHGKEEGL